MAHSNADLARRELQAVNAGDLAALREIYTEDFVFHYPGRSPLAGDYRGFDGLRDFAEKVGDVAGEQMEREAHAIVADDEHAVQLLTVRATRKDGRTHEWNAVVVLHLRDGKFNEAWVHVDDPYAHDEFLSG
ncbi:MAG TPA: nuclear transport factor 2 family protein [Actinomycetota bacterium]|nr:nuclear transport factor 2 family protein [Actinomycetota bacterium]